MEKALILRVKAFPSPNQGHVRLKGSLHDKTPFMIEVQNHLALDVKGPVPEDGTSAWVEVREFARDGDRSFIVMPASDIQRGKNVSVSIYDLMPVDVSLAHFHPRTIDNEVAHGDTERAGG